MEGASQETSQGVISGTLRTGTSHTNAIVVSDFTIATSGQNCINRESDDLSRAQKNVLLLPGRREAR